MSGTTSLRSIIAGAKIVLGIRVLASGLSYVAIVVLARVLGASEYGIYTYVFAWLTVVSLLVRVGWPGAAVRYLPIYENENRWDLVAGFLQTSRARVLGLSSLAAALGLMVLWFVRSHIDAALVWPFAVGLLGLPVLALAPLLAQIGRAFGWVAIAYGPPQVLHPVLLVAAAGFLWWHGNASALTMVSVSIGAWVLLTALQQALYTSRLRPQLTSTTAEFRHTEWARAGWALLVVDGLAIGLSQIDMLLLGGFVPASDVGHYSAAVRISMLVHFCIQSMTSLAEPRMAALWSQRDRAELRRVWRGTLRYGIVPAIALTGFIVAFGRPLLRLFGPDFDQAYTSLVVLTLGNLAVVIAGPAVPALKAAGQRRPCVVVLTLACILAAVLDIVLIPIYGIVGAAFGTAVALTLAHASLSILVRRELLREPKPEST